MLVVGAQYLPLTRELHYELSAVAALWTSIGTGIAALVTWRRRTQHTGPVASIVHAIAWALATTVPPLLIALAFNLVNRTCGVGEGILWYLLLVPPSAIIAVAIARLARTMTATPWTQVAIFLFLWGASMARGAVEALSGPHIFMYAWQVGYFPGGSWDPELPITPLLLAYRATHVLFASLLLLLLVEIETVRTTRRRRGAAVLLPASLAAAIVIVLVPLRSEIGLTRTDHWLRETLGDSVRTRFTTIYYDATTTDSLDIWRAANYADFYVRRHARALGIRMRAIAPITFYAYSSGAEQKRLVGTSSASFTKPWRRTMNLSFDRVETTLEHELVHVVLEPYGNVLGISWSTGILEGAAVALEHGDDVTMLHRHARAAYDMELAPPVERLMSATGFASHRSSLSYMVAGSFCRWLIDNYGKDRFLRSYASGSLADRYPRTFEHLADEYGAFLATLPPTDPSLETTVRYLYSGGSFFLQRCLRRIATLTGEGYRALADDRYDDALARFDESLALGITSGARAGVIRTLHAAGRYGDLVDSMRVYIDRDSLGTQLLPYLIELSDAQASVGGDRVETLTEALRTGGDEWTRVRAALRLLLTDGTAGAVSSGDSVATAMLEYFRRPMTIAARVSLLTTIEKSAASEGASQRLLSLMRASQLVRATPLLAVSSIDLSGVTPDTSRLAGYASSALMRTLNDGFAMRIWSDGQLTPDERRESLRWINAAYRYPSPAPRSQWPQELVLAERPHGTFAAFLQHLDWHGVVETPRARH